VPASWGLLAISLPVERAPTLVHGDYHYGNMLFRGSQLSPSSTGDRADRQPLLDLGCLFIAAIRNHTSARAARWAAIDRISR